MGGARDVAHNLVCAAEGTQSVGGASMFIPTSVLVCGLIYIFCEALKSDSERRTRDMINRQIVERNMRKPQNGPFEDLIS
jgi:hypothetical protein